MFALGIAITTVGFLTEIVAFVAMESYPLRRTLPLKSPLQLLSIGCVVFFLGAFTLVLARLC